MTTYYASVDTTGMETTTARTDYASIVRSLRLDGRRQRIELGDLVRARRDGRIGKVVDINTTTLYVRFEDSAKAVYMYRQDVDGLRFIQGHAESIEDDANAAAYKAARR